MRRGSVLEAKSSRPQRRAHGPRIPSAQRAGAGFSGDKLPRPTVSLPEELLDMNADEFREVLRDVIREELGMSEVALGGRWQDGELVLKPGKEGTQEKHVPIDVFFRKIVGIRDKLRVLEQKINGHAKLAEDEKLQLQQYITQCYGALTTFNLLFAEKNEGFVGQKGEGD
jgi:hypothetical protein